MGSGYKDICIWSDKASIVTTFLHVIKQSDSYSSSKLYFGRVHSDKTKAFIYLYSTDFEYSRAVEHSSWHTDMTKFFIKVAIQDTATSMINLQRASTNGNKHEMFLDIYNRLAVEEALAYINKVLEKTYHFLSIKLTYKGMRVLKWSSFLCLLLSAVLSIVVILMAGTIAITRDHVSERWFSNSLLTSGSLTFVMSFVGFYGVKKSGIKEYLKIYSAVLVVAAVYNLILLIIYTQMSWQPKAQHMIIPVLVTCILFEILTSCIIYIELNVVKTSNI